LQKYKILKNIKKFKILKNIINFKIIRKKGIKFKTEKFSKYKIEIVNNRNYYFFKFSKLIIHLKNVEFFKIYQKIENL